MLTMLQQRAVMQVKSAIMQFPSSEKFSWEDVRLLLAAARSTTIAGVASRLGVNATTVSRRLAALEADLQAALFVRSHGRLALSGLGKQLLPFAEAMERAARAMGAEVASQTETPSGQIRISAPPTFSRYVLGPGLSTLAVLYPNISVDLDMAATNVDVERSEADIAVRLDLPDLRSDNVKSRTLGWMSYAPYGPATGDAGERWISYSHEYAHTPQAQWIERQPNGGRPVLRCNDPEVLATAAGAAMGNTLLAVALGRQRADLKQIGPVALRRKLWLLQNRDVARASHVQAFTRWLITLCKEQLEPENAPMSERA